MSTKLASWAAAYSRHGEVVDTMLTSLMAYQDSITLGLGVEEYEPHGRAAREIRATLEWIFRRVKETKR